jgi:antitoxin component YwqK of YwqJK toxin-antitoxin module
MINPILRILSVALLAAGVAGCGAGGETPASGPQDDSPSMVKKKRDDGTLSSINPVDEDGFVHGVKVNYYEDGKTVHSKITYVHGRKHGPALWYYRNGQVYEHTSFHYGRKHGLTKRYYETGELMEELTYEAGEELPGKKRFNRQGQLISP